MPPGSLRYCPQCNDGTVLEHTTKDLTEALRGSAVHVPVASDWHCPKCGKCETVLPEIAIEVRTIRKKLGLKQHEAAKLFGGGINAFSEYELGKTRPHKSTLQLLRLLNRHPELLNEINPI
ncbi:antitoxin [Betaproteobacteria bacterium]|nr:antitoxin [Betaproteobacteria bacterium]